MHGYFVANYPSLTEPVPYTFVSVNRRNNEVQVHAHCNVNSAFIFRRFTDTHVRYTVPVSLKYGKLATKYKNK